jgi:hypothetical protein
MPRPLFCLTWLLLLTPSAQAHVKWFVEEEQLALVTPPALVWCYLAIAVSFIVFAGLHRLHLLFPERVSKSTDEIVLPLLRVALALALMGASVQGYLLAPNLALGTTELDLLLRLLQFFVGLVLLTDRAGGWGIFFLLLFLPLSELPEHLDLAGLAAFLVLCSRINCTGGAPFVWARRLVGVTFISLALAEKLVCPSYSLAFLQQHQWNFLSPIGLNDTVFVLCAGAVELVLGLLLLSGVYPRLCGLALLSLMTSTCMLLGVAELLGHLPTLAFAYALIVAKPPNPQPMVGPETRSTVQDTFPLTL